MATALSNRVAPASTKPTSDATANAPTAAAIATTAPKPPTSKRPTRADAAVATTSAAIAGSASSGGAWDRHDAKRVGACSAA